MCIAALELYGLRRACVEIATKLQQIIVIPVTEVWKIIPYLLTDWYPSLLSRLFGSYVNYALLFVAWR